MISTRTQVSGSLKLFAALGVMRIGGINRGIISVRVCSFRRAVFNPRHRISQHWFVILNLKR